MNTPDWLNGPAREIGDGVHRCGWTPVLAWDSSPKWVCRKCGAECFKTEPPSWREMGVEVRW